MLIRCAGLQAREPACLVGCSLRKMATSPSSTLPSKAEILAQIPDSKVARQSQCTPERGQIASQPQKGRPERA